MTGAISNFTNTTVTKIDIERGAAIGVRCLSGNQFIKIEARKRNLAMRGSRQSLTPTAATLRIGPGKLLQTHGVQSVLEHPHVGRHLQDHLGISYFYRANRPTLNRTLRSWPGRSAPESAMSYPPIWASPFSVNQIGGWPDPRAGLKTSDTQLYCNPVSYQPAEGRNPASLCRTPTPASSWVLIRAAPPAKDSSRSAHLIHMHRLGSPPAI